MIISIIGMIICCLVVAVGIYYLVKEKGDKESRKIYGVITAIGTVIFYFSGNLIFSILEKIFTVC